MNSKQPELSIFQGVPSIYVDKNQQRAEEEEAIRDQARRQKELQAEVEKEFGDITVDDYDEDDDDPEDLRASSIGNGHAEFPHRDFPLRDEFTSLRNLVETKSRELEQISSVLKTERLEHKRVIDEYEKRLAIAEAEKERALMNRNQTQEILVETKGKVIELNDKIQSCMTKFKALENENEQLVAELESTKLMLSEVQTKYNMVEKNVMFNAERNTDLIIKQAQERHSAQMTIMQQQIDTLKSKYDDLEHEHKHLDIRYKELLKSREAILIEKSEIINQLNRNLEESQKHCQELLSRPDVTQENRRLQNALQTLEYQNEELSMTVKSLHRKIQEQTSEMEMIDSIINECEGNNQSFSEMSKFLHRDPLKNVNSTPLTADAKNNKVKEELCKSLQNIKRKREEIKILEKQITEKDNEILELKKDESKTLVELNKYREETFRLETKLNSMQKELEKAHNDLKAHHENSNLKEENEKLLKELDVKRQESDELRIMIEELKINESEFSTKLDIEQRKLEELTNELIEARTKQLSVDKLNKSIQLEIDRTPVCTQCEKYTTEIGTLKTRNEQLKSSIDEYLTEVNNLKQDLADAHQTVDNLKSSMTLQNLRDKEIEKLQTKAKEFEDFMRTNGRKDSVSSTVKSSQESSTNTTSDSPEPTNSSPEMRSYNESKIRDEMARIFASQIKLIETKFMEETKRLHNEITSLSNELESKTTNLEMATEQLELLKFTIVHEREEFETILRKREESYKHNMEQYQKHVDELNSQIDLIDEERKVVNSLKTEIENERKVLIKREEDTVKKLKTLQQESTKIIEELNEKYKAAKKKSALLKQYSDDKEKHYRNECERIKNGYAEAVEKIHTRLNETLTEREESYKQKIKKIEQEYEFKVDILKGMLEKYQKSEDLR